MSHSSGNAQGSTYSHQLECDNFGCLPSSMVDDPVSDIRIDDLRQVFHLCSDDAAEQLGIGLNHLKRLCRSFDIGRWPQRKLSSLLNLADEVQDDEHLQTEERQGVLASIQENYQLILQSPQNGIFPKLNGMRNRAYKKVFNKRRRVAHSRGVARGMSSEADSVIEDDMNLYASFALALVPPDLPLLSLMMETGGSTPLDSPIALQEDYFGEAASLSDNLGLGAIGGDEPSDHQLYPRLVLDTAPSGIDPLPTESLEHQACDLPATDKPAWQLQRIPEACSNAWSSESFPQPGPFSGFQRVDSSGGSAVIRHSELDMPAALSRDFQAVSQPDALPIQLSRNISWRPMPPDTPEVNRLPAPISACSSPGMLFARFPKPGCLWAQLRAVSEAPADVSSRPALNRPLGRQGGAGGGDSLRDSLRDSLIMAPEVCSPLSSPICMDDPASVATAAISGDTGSVDAVPLPGSPLTDLHPNAEFLFMEGLNLLPLSATADADGTYAGCEDYDMTWISSVVFV